MYWIYRTRLFYHHEMPVQADLRSPTPAELKRLEQTSERYRSPKQMGPFGVDFHFRYQTPLTQPLPDNLYDGYGFALYSNRLIGLLEGFGVQAETFPAQLVDHAGRPLAEQSHSVYHLLEGILQAMDEAGSAWTGSASAGIPRLALDLARFEHRPMFFLNHLYLPLMRSDVKQALQREHITGFYFLKPENYRSGQYGLPGPFTE